MSEKSLLFILLAGALANNYVLGSFLGADTLLYSARDTKKSAVMGGMVTVLMLVSTLVTWALDRLVLVPLGAEFMRSFLFLLLVVALAYLLELLAKKLLKKPLGAAFPLLAINGAVLSVALTVATEGLNLGQAMLHALGSGVGFLLAAVAFSCAKSRINEKYVPRAFRGLPINLLALGIIAMAIYAF